MYWDEEIYCFDDGNSTSGFYYKKSNKWIGIFKGEEIGTYKTKKHVKNAIEIRFIEFNVPPSSSKE